MKHIKQDFCYDTWVKPQGIGFHGIKKNFEHGHVAYQIDGDDE